MRRRALLVAATAAIGATAALAPTASAEPAVAITAGPPQQVLSFDTATPSAATSQPITGLRNSEVLRGIDLRPATGTIYGYGSRGGLYTLNAQTGAATRTFQFGSDNDFRYGVDFNPTVDRLRIVNNNDDNLRVNVDTGGVTTDLPLAYSSTDRNAGVNPEVTGSAYTNNFAGAQATVLYGLDSGTDTLVTQAPPNNGVLNTIGSLGVPFQANNGFDISGATGVAFAALTPGASTASLYRIDLGTGAATLLGKIGDGTVRIGGLTVTPAPAPTAAR